jgi:hypothetical protein
MTIDDDVDILEHCIFKRTTYADHILEHHGTFLASFRDHPAKQYNYHLRDDKKYELRRGGNCTVFTWEDKWKTNRSLKAAIKLCRC